MAKAIQISSYGAPEVLKLTDLSPITPKPDEIVIRQTAIGINFHDIYVRSGLYKTLSLPGIPGIEGAGVITKIGSEVTSFSIGDRVAYITSSYGGYASERSLPAAIAVPIPDGISDVIAASVILKGLTVQMLANKVARIKKGDAILVHAAAGGVGQLLVQEAKNRGATVFGTVGSDVKAEIAKNKGCDHIIRYREENVYDRVMDVTNGTGLRIIYDSVGKDTFYDSLASLDFGGHLVNFGQSSGPIENFEVSMLAKKSATLSRPMIFHYVRKRQELLHMSQTLFKAIKEGDIKTTEPLQMPLKEASKAHELLTSRTLTQSIVLIP
ncbi:quinone oxidoreductase family protein [Zobellia uliginosa]|uniref:quinone oxidoreductase family protein n=1 Tax=Zobellia uliginosa TaxID=143224 RepID=UPI001C06F2F4|nr:quinone oxidoreductase [Zobellia uliginosa]MBU2946539.1 quinone oxidoreductase [Zobellia uliginosa]